VYDGIVLVWLALAARLGLVGAGFTTGSQAGIQPHRQTHYSSSGSNIAYSILVVAAAAAAAAL